MATRKSSAKDAGLRVPAGFDDLPLPLLVFRANPRALWCNRKFEESFGALRAGQFTPARKLGLVQERPVDESLFSTPGRHEGYALPDRDGQKTPVEFKVSPLPGSGEGVHLVIFEDVSHKQELERQLIENHLSLRRAYEDLNRAQSALTQSAKLASLGELSSGIAHELNQPLQAILGFSEELRDSEKLSPAGMEFLTDIVNASRKMAEIIRSLRSFAREAGDETIETPVELAVREAAKIVHHSLLQKGIELDIRVEGAETGILANPIQLEQVFVNLLSNAMDAIEQAHPGRGRIEIRVAGSASGITVTVSDDGSGMTEEVRQRIFDPFFTTKEVGKGTGLGLSISYGILKKIGAAVEVRSTPGHGTRFTLNFRPIGLTKEGEAA